VGGYYAFRDQADQINFDASTTGAWGGAIGYTFGNSLRVMAAYDEVEEAANPAVLSGDGRNAFIGGRWDIAQFKVLAGYRWRSLENIGTGGRDLDSNLYMAGLGYQMSPALDFMLTYHQENFRRAPDGYLGTRDDKWKQVSFMASYALSKRTNLYFTAAYAKDGPINLGHAGDAGNAYQLAAGEASQVAGAIGLRHMF